MSTEQQIVERYKEQFKYDWKAGEHNTEEEIKFWLSEIATAKKDLLGKAMDGKLIVSLEMKDQIVVQNYLKQLALEEGIELNK